ncbi:hypothetical protein RR48_07326 [Papilio machaon]|uniref:Death domain-containing protein n=1 Tax=Papilio machaon TaxID=76193 RepID=A0A194RKI3_PAPMA|nr:hypothetical protein RR48_07326 [Papilio machaon]
MNIILTLIVTINIWCMQFTISTIDISNNEFEYLSCHLTYEECRRFVASLYFTSSELPEILPKAVEKIPPDVSCYDLLINWNSGKEKWKGWGKTHEIVTRRLRQIDKIDLSQWLGTTVFHNLAKQINETIIKAFEVNTKDKVNIKHKLEDGKKYLEVENHWDIIDSVLSGGIICVFFAIIFVCCRILWLACKRIFIRNNAQDEELVCLLKDRNVK